MALSNPDEILEFAINNEQKAHDFYMDLAQRVPGMKAVFEGFAQEELGHKAKLQGVKEKGRLVTSTKKVIDLKLADYLVEVDSSNGELEYQDALILAMKREKAAFRLYSDLANTTDDNDLKLLFLGLAQEEAKHKLHFEVAYDDEFLAQN